MKKTRKRKTAKVYSYQINLVYEPEGGYSVTVPLLPGCDFQGSWIALRL